MKRTRREDPLPDEETTGFPRKTAREWDTEFSLDVTKQLIRNTVTLVGSTYASTDSSEASKVSHIFTHTLKEHQVKATDQGQSGRCWLFAGLNVLRHLLMRALDMQNFEYSETYLFFWDKFERAYFFTNWFLEKEHIDVTARDVQYMLSSYRDDGGYWEHFVNLVEKYGIVPKTAMPETAHSGFSEDMNAVIHDHLDTFVATLRRSVLSIEAKRTLQTQVMKHIYDTLVKFMGTPPRDFVWTFIDTDHDGHSMRLTPQKFTSMILPPGMNLKDFVVLGNIPSERASIGKRYEISTTSNLVGGKNASFINLPIEELKRFTKIQVTRGIPVWFGSDVTRQLHFPMQTLSTKLLTTDKVFGETSLTKKERVDLMNSGAKHAMAFVGYSVTDSDVVHSWQVENSWGYWDEHEPGADGFLCMEDAWFDENVFLVVVHKSVLSRTVMKKIKEMENVILNPWDSVAPAVRTTNVYYGF